MLNKTPMVRKPSENQTGIRHLPVIMIFIVAAVYLITDFTHKDWEKKDMKSVIRWDVLSYYEYLPATFIYGDITLEFAEKPGFRLANKFWNVRADNGNKVILTSMGLSYLYAPFFFMAHAAAPLVGDPRDGYSPVYQFFLVMSSLVYLIIGLFILKAILSRYFRPLAVALTLLLIALGTNLYYYGTYEAAMSHSYNFVLILAFLWSGIRWLEKPSVGITIGTGLLFGLITLIRPSNILALILLVLWGIDSFPALWERILFFRKNAWKIVIMIAAFLVPWIPQFIYWYSLTGHIFYNPYGKTGSAFFFGSPHIADILFSYRKGWFIYVPVMFFAVAGLIPLFFRWRRQFWVITVYLMVMTWVLASWWAWWYGGSYGPRAFIDIYGVMAIPLAALIHMATGRKTYLRIITFLVAGFLVYSSIFQTLQYRTGTIHFVGMTKTAFWKNYLRWKEDGTFWQHLSIPDYELARKGIYYNYSSGDSYGNLKKMPLEDATDSVRTEITGDKKLMQDIGRYARRNEIPQDSALEMVVRRVTEMKTEGKPF